MWDDVVATTGRSFVADFNRIIGGVRLRQTRRAKDDCPGLDELKSWYNMQCYSDRQSQAQFGTDGAQGFSSSVDNEYNYWLDIFEDEEAVLRHVRFLEAAEWLSPATKDVTVEALLYNAQVALAVYVRVRFELSRSGLLRSQAIVKVLPTQVYISALTWMGDIFLLVLLLWLGFGEIARFYKALRSRR
eukprot:513728-Amphidinium_carterae.1